MDYSLLLGIHDTSREDAREEPEEEETIATRSEKKNSAVGTSPTVATT